MQFLPSAILSQYSSKFLACGNWPAMPMTAIGSDGRAVRAPVDLVAPRPRHDVSFSAACRIAVVCAAGALLRGDAGIDTAGAVLRLDSVPCRSASALTY